MRVAYIELVRAAQVVQMGVCNNDDRVALEQVGKVFAKAGYTQPGVDNQVAIASPHMPDVGTQEKVHLWLDYDTQPVSDLRGDEPVISDWHGRDNRTGSGSHFNLSSQ